MLFYFLFIVSNTAKVKREFSFVKCVAHTFDERKLAKGITVHDKTSKVKTDKKLTLVFKMKTL